jgi:hypothetical protein
VEGGGEVSPRSGAPQDISEKPYTMSLRSRCAFECDDRSRSATSWPGGKDQIPRPPPRVRRVWNWHFISYARAPAKC